jgi:hypothetical protein
VRPGATRRREIPASVPATQPRNRKRRDVNAPERLRRRLYSVNDRGTNHGRVRNNDRALIPSLFGGEPFSHPQYEVCNGFAAVRRGRRIAQPGRNRIRLARLHFVKPATRPASIVAIAYAGSTFAFNPKACAVCRVRSSGLVQHRPAFGKVAASAAARVAPGSSRGSSAGKLAERTASVEP